MKIIIMPLKTIENIKIIIANHHLLIHISIMQEMTICKDLTLRNL